MKQWYYQNVEYVVVKNQDLSKNKKQGPFTKEKERIQKIKETGEITKYLYRNKLDKDCFQHDMTYGDGLWL